MQTETDGAKVYRSIYSIVEHIRERGLVLYGAGYLGKMAFQIFELFQVRPSCFCDDDPKKQGTDFKCNGSSVPIISLDEAVQRFPDAVYIPTAASARKVGPRDLMKKRLQERNLLSQDSAFYPQRYLFLLDGGLEAAAHPAVPGDSNFTPERLKNIVLLSSNGRSGTIFFDTLMDGHPNILNIGEFGSNVYSWKNSYLNQLQYLEGSELVIEVARHMQAYFTSHTEKHNLLCNYVNRDGDYEERIYISPTGFISALAGQLMGKGRVSFTFLFKAIFSAYHNTIGKPYIPGQPYWIFFETHLTDCNTTEYDGLLSPTEFERFEYLVTIREPVQQVFSIIQLYYQYFMLEKRYGRFRPTALSECFSGSLCIGLERNVDNQNKSIKVIRFEDVKKRTPETMQAVCKWMGIEFDECMLETTINGIEVYFPSAATDKNKAISSRDTTAIDRHDFSKFLSSYDIFRLNLAFQNVQRVYGYNCDVPDYHTFSQAFWKELFQKPFRYEEWMNDLYATLQKLGYIKLDEADCHSGIVKMILDYFKEESHELITDMILPEEDAGLEKT